MKPTLVLGASPKSYRNSHQLASRLHLEGYPVWAVGRSGGKIGEIDVLQSWPALKPGMIDTVSIYLNPQNQKEYYQYLIELKPRRMIFNPGAENTELGNLAQKAGIKVEYRCSQVMMALGEF